MTKKETDEKFWRLGNPFPQSDKEDGFECPNCQQKLPISLKEKVFADATKCPLCHGHPVRPVCEHCGGVILSPGTPYAKCWACGREVSG